jgi:hypothetical protein
MNISEWLARSWGRLDPDERIAHWQWGFAAHWAQENPVWLTAGCIALVSAAWLFYAWRQPGGRAAMRSLLGACRSILLCLPLVVLAEPVLRLTIAGNERPLVWLLFDASQSMAIRDELPDDELTRLTEALEIEQPLRAKEACESDDLLRLARVDWLRALLKKKRVNLPCLLAGRFRLEAYAFSRVDGADRLPLELDSAAIDVDALSNALTSDGQVTALGAALDDLARRPGASQLAGVVVFSDFDENSGPSAVEAARRFSAPIYAVGVGQTTAVDLSVALETRGLMKATERETPRVVVRHTGLDGRSVEVHLTARRLGRSTLDQDEVLIGRKSITLGDPTVIVEFPYVPSEAGRWLLSAHADVEAGESSGENNDSQCEVSVRDDFLRLLFVENEPTWEWRFIKEVFQRDPLVGPAGFRTFLRSADPQVRRTGGIFLPSLTPSRSDFFAHDVILLGDMPAAALSTRFCELVEEFVGKFGGGLVVVAGPRFGPGPLADTPLAALLPVVVDPTARAVVDRPFELTPTAMAANTDFMRLADADDENAKAWRNLGPLSWYQGVRRALPGTVLAEHPRDVCADGRTPQPLIAVRRYGRGEVVYLAFNETWRLRRKYGERYYRQFWGQMIRRLALGHAVGSQKRFRARTDRQKYLAGEQVLLSVEAYDQNFEPLQTDRQDFRAVSGEWVVPGRLPEQDRALPFTIPAARPGVFESRMRVDVAGEHRINVMDPVTGEFVEEYIHVSATSPEQRSVVRNVDLAGELAAATGGKSYDLANADELLDDLQAPSVPETRLEVLPLWNTWPVFCFAVGLMLTEWWARRRVNLP